MDTGRHTSPGRTRASAAGSSVSGESEEEHHDCSEQHRAEEARATAAYAQAYAALVGDVVKQQEPARPTGLSYWAVDRLDGIGRGVIGNMISSAMCVESNRERARGSRRNLGIMDEAPRFFKRGARRLGETPESWRQNGPRGPRGDASRGAKRMSAITNRATRIGSSIEPGMVRPF
jgi:hypothetical protein